MTNAANNPQTTTSSNMEPPDKQTEFGYGKPPKQHQFKKGQSGNLAGRPKKPIGISIKDIFDGDQLGKNGEVISRREAYLIALVNDALQCKPRSFSKFMRLMHRAGLIRSEITRRPSVVEVPMRTLTPEEYEEHISKMSAPPTRT